jgi:FixJ family two-component response regulator
VEEKMRCVISMPAAIIATLVTIVDDDEVVRSALTGLMKSAGFPALAFTSAEEFLSSGE